MGYIPLPSDTEEGLVKLIKSMYAEYDPQMVTFSCTKKNPYSGDGSFYSGSYRHTFVWECDPHPYIVRGPTD